jgi:hypothetical protein
MTIIELIFSGILLVLITVSVCVIIFNNKLNKDNIYYTKLICDNADFYMRLIKEIIQGNK